MNDLDKLFGLLTKTKLYTNSKEEFIEKYSTPENQDKLFGLLSKTKLYTNSKEDFMSKYFPTAEPPKDEGVISREELLKEIDKPKGGSPEAVDTTDSNFASGGTSSSSESRFGLEDKLIQKKSTISNPRIKSIEDIKRSLSGYKAVKDYDNKFLEEVPAEDKKTYIDRARKKLEGEYSEAYKDIDKESNLGFNITESLINKEAVNLIKGDRDKKLYEGTDMSEQAKLKLKSGFLSTGSNLAGVPNFINKSLFTLFAPDDLVEELNKLTPEQREAVINQNMPKVGSINLVGSIGMLSAETQNKLKERANKVSESIVQFDRSIGQDFSDGNWGKALFRAFNEGAASAPSLVQAVIPYVGLPSIALGSMSGKQEELEDEGFGLGYDTTLNSVVTGTAEAVFERVTQKLGGKLIDAFKKAPLNGRQQMVSALKQVATGVGEEGGSEALTSTVQILSDVLISGKEKDIEDAFEEVIDAFIVGGAMGGMVSSVTQGVTQLKSLKEELDINKIVASDSNNFKDVSDAFDTGSKVEPSSLDLLSLSTTDYVLDKTLNKKVKRGEITEGQSKAIKKNYLESKQAYEKTKAIKGISSDNQVKATNLLKRKAQLIEEIAKSDDILSQPKKQELESINKNLEEILASPEEKLAKEKIEEVTKKIKDDKDVQEQEINKTEDKEAKDQDSQEGVQEVTTTKKTTKVSEAINRPVTVTTLGGSKLDTPIEGDMYVEGQQVVIEDVDGNITELGNVDEVSDSTLGELGVEIQEESVEVTNKGNLKIGDDVLVPERSGIKKDKRGNVSRVVLRTEDGSKTVTLRGAKAEDAAYQILLKEAMSPEQNQAINEKLEQDEEFQNKLREAEESTKERTDKDTTEVTEQTKSEPEVKKDNKLTEGTKKVLKQVELAKKAVKKILPNVEFVIHNTTAELEKATGQVARGVFERSANGKNNKIHISLEGANDRTVAHEVFHAVLANKLGSESRIQKVTADMVSRLSKNLDPKTNETLIRFMNKYKDTNPEDMNEEFVSELFGMLANDYTKFDRSTKHLVKRWLNKVAEQLGLGEFIRFKDTAKDEEVMQLLETVAGKVSLGEVVSEGDVTMLVSNGTIKAPKKYKSSKFVDDMVLERWDTHKNTKVIKDFDLKDIEGQSASSTLSDKLVAGKLGNFKLFGGVGYPEATGLLWAASSRRAAQLIVSKIKRSMDGNNYLVPAIMSNVSHMSNKDMTVVAIEVLKEAAGNKELDIKGLKEKVDRVFKKNALLKFREGAIESVKDSKDVIKGLDSFLDFLLNPKFTFERRRAVLESLIGESKVGKAKFKTVGTFTQLAESLAEPMVKDSGIYQVDIVFRTKGDLKVVEIKKEDPRYHKSYPFAIESSDIIESLHLKNSYNLVDIFPEFTKESGEVKSLAQEFADKRGKYSDEYIRTNFGRTHGLSKYSEPIVADKPIMKSQKWDESKRGKQRLEGAPLMKKRKNVSGADLELTNLAEAYAKDKGIDYRRQSEYVKVDPNRAKRIAEEYEKMKHEPNNPKVKEAYQNLIDQTLDQYKVLKDAGYEFYFFDETNDPYNGSPWAAMEELRNDKKMAVFSTESGFGTDEKVDVSDNPMLADTGFKWEYKGKMRPVLANDLFRAVHDAFGHGIEGSGFRARGEENAWQAHARLFTGSAVAAITTETRGQNSWLNYGKFGEQNRTASVEETIFADQKTGLMPEWTWKEGFDEGVEPKSTFKSQKVDKENYDKIRENSKRYRQEIGNKHKTVTSRFKDFMAKSYDASVDRQGLVKKALNKIGLNDVVSYMVTRAGAASFAKSKIEDAYKKTFSDLTADEWVYLEEIIQLKRTISIEKNRADRGLEMIDRMGGFDAEMSESALREYKRVLGDDVYAKLEKRSENYFKVFKDILKDMKSEGLINQEFYDRFAEVDYKPTAYVKFLLDMDGDFLETEADRVGSFGLSGDMIRNMKKGSVGLEVMDAWGLLQGAMITRTKANFANRLNSTFAEEFEKTSKRADELVKKDKSDLTKEEAKFLEDFANVKANVKMDSFVYRTKKDGTVVQKFKSEGKNNKGWKFLYYYKDGVKNRVQMKEEFFNKFTDTSLELMPSGTKDVISTLSGTKLVKSLATGNNPLFFITNLPRDFMFTLMFSKEYSNNIIPNMVRLVRDMTKGIKDVVTDSDSYKKYLEYGGGMDFLSLQGRYKEGTLGQKMISKVLSQKTVDKITQNKALKAFGKFNLASEAGLRLVVFNKSIQNQLKDLGVKSVEEIKDKKQVDLIYTNAVRSAREMTDFNQGGTVSKAVDSFVPYLNASIQGTRAATREIKERPWDFTIRAVQVAGVSASFALSTSMSIMMLTKGDEEDEDMKLADKYFKTLETISEYDLRNYFIIPLGVKDSNKNWKYLRVAKSHFMTPLINAAEHAQRKFMAGQTGNKYHEELGKTLKSSVSNNILPIIPDLDVTQRIPAVGAGIAMLGIDPYTGNNLDWKRGEVYTQNEGIVDDRVDPMYKAIGLSLGVAPARLQKATESFITSPSVNLYVGASYVMGNMTSKALSSHDLGDYTITETFTEPLFRRLVKSGSDYNYKSKVLKPDTSEGAEVDRAVIYRKKGVKEAGMLIKEGKSEEALKKITELIEKYPEDAKLIRAGLNNEVAKKSKHPIINEILFERNPKKKAFMLYQLFGDDLVNISSKDKELRETFIQLRKDKAITRDVLKYYFDHVSEVKSKK